MIVIGLTCDIQFFISLVSLWCVAQACLTRCIFPGSWFYYTDLFPLPPAHLPYIFSALHSRHRLQIISRWLLLILGSLMTSSEYSDAIASHLPSVNDILWLSLCLFLSMLSSVPGSSLTLPDTWPETSQDTALYHLWTWNEYHHTDLLLQPSLPPQVVFGSKLPLEYIIRAVST